MGTSVRNYDKQHKSFGCCEVEQGLQGLYESFHLSQLSHKPSGPCSTSQHLQLLYCLVQTKHKDTCLLVVQPREAPRYLALTLVTAAIAQKLSSSCFSLWNGGQLDPVAVVASREE